MYYIGVDLGVDLAGFGSDRTVRRLRQGAFVHEQRVTQQDNLMQTAGRVLADLKDREHCNACIDVIGLGGGVVDRSKEVIGRHGSRVKGINVAESAMNPERFPNKRAEGYWRLREAFESQSIMIPDDDELVKEMTSLKYKAVHSNGTIKMEEKEEAKKPLGNAPDLADSLMLTYIIEEEGTKSAMWAA